MSTRYDVRDAKEAYERHIATHKCGGLNLEDPERKFRKCEARSALWTLWMRTAHRWYEEPGDDARQRRQFFEHHPNALRTPTYRKAT